MRRIITAIVNNQSGVLNRVTGLLSKRQFNIESISVGLTETPSVSRMTFVVDVEDDAKLEQLIKQLNKQIDVLKVSDITDMAIVARELALVKVMSRPQTRGEIRDLVETFRATVIDIGRDSLTIQVTGETDKVEALIELLRPYGIKELARTGVTAFTRGMQKTNAELKTFSLLK
ncbi:acetolactate synthase small subunit [Pullulanibacillus sp. KACC 23026]|uniref:acetolactate synthase small subunit n=1 Tax=Pullulanibacillus sp. KACC 23026 TaxID=3028315 RepID=UPI0023AF9C5D|nr:acetolactate synthase small subunit [Pullulanibacillus sp. KACC 23026]WEG11429.1 acetolactate synthase small subunit [Pullulanibacillus sp. KACC 23026]